MNLKLHPLLLIVLGGPLLLSAQNYSLNRSRLTSGGGQSAGGNFTLRGSLGQAEAGTPLTGGGYSLTGGFRAKVGIIQTPDAPKLTVASNPDGTVTIRWSSAAGWSLQQSDQLTAESWAGSVQPVTENGPDRSVTLTPPAGWRFFRLHKPN